MHRIKLGLVWLLLAVPAAPTAARAMQLTLLQASIDLLMNRQRLAAVAGRLKETWLQSVNASLRLRTSR